MAFGADAIGPVTLGLIRSTGSFAERMVSRGYIGDILTAPSGIIAVAKRIFMNAWSFMKRALSQPHKGI